MDILSKIIEIIDKGETFHDDIIPELIFKWFFKNSNFEATKD